MANSDFWRSLADQFRALPREFSILRADRASIVGSDGIGQWNLIGTTTHSVQFEALARHAASQLPNPVSMDLLTAWLEALIKQGYARFNSEVITTSQNPDEMQITGGLYNLPELSANYCKMLESAALQTEFEEKQRNNPRNWSQFRQQYEALRSMKDLINEPAERIQEDWVRNTIARIHGIKPEDVTRKQIAFEIAGLLSSTKRHIEMIPSAPQESPPIPEPRMKLSDHAEPKSIPAVSLEEAIAVQLQRLREECRWTIPELAEATDLSTRQVARHLSGKFQPLPRNVSAYERAFGKRLRRQIVIKKMS